MFYLTSYLIFIAVYFLRLRRSFTRNFPYRECVQITTTHIVIYALSISGIWGVADEAVLNKKNIYK